MQHLKEGKVARFSLALNSEAFDILDSYLTELGCLDIQSVMTYSHLCKMHCVYVVAMFFCCNNLQAGDASSVLINNYTYVNAFFNIQVSKLLILLLCYCVCLKSKTLCNCLSSTSFLYHFSGITGIPSRKIIYVPPNS